MQKDITEKSQVRSPYLENPFSKATEVSCDLLLVPSSGIFLDYTNKTGLHIAIISNGRILEYDYKGICCHRVTSAEIRWQQCLRLKFKNHLLDINGNAVNSNKIDLAWNRTVELFLGQERANWSEQKYDPNEHNCFDFAISFLVKFIDQLSLDQPHHSKFAILKEKLIDKNLFCEHFILPETKKAAKYISSYRRKIKRPVFESI